MASFKSQGWFNFICDGELHPGSLCTQRVLIDGLNLGFAFTFFSGLIISFLNRKRGNGVRIPHWHSIVGSLCFATTSAVYFGFGLWSLLHSTDEKECVIYFVRWLIWLSLVVSMNVYEPKWLESIILLWWFLFSVLDSALNVEVLIRTRNVLTIDIILWPVILLLLFYTIKRFTRVMPFQKPTTSNLSEPLLINEDSKKNSSLGNASTFSRLTFSWLNPLLRLGSSRALGLGDIPPLDFEDEANLAYLKFSEKWDKSRTNNLVLFALAKCYTKEMLVVGVYALLRTISVCVTPLLLYAFVWYSKLENKDIKIGTMLIGCTLVVKLVESLCQRHWFFDSRRFGMRMRSAVMAAIYQKQLKLSSVGRVKHSTGEIVNYIAVDAYRLGDALWWFHMGWSMPLQLVLSVGILFGVVGWGALPGLVPLTVIGILNVPIAKTIQYYQSQSVVEQDERLRATSEVLNNMKIIKLNSWEEKFKSKVLSLRDTEFKWLRETQFAKAYGTGVYWMSPTIVSAVVFAGTAILSGRDMLNATTVFTILATLRVMAEPVRMLPEVMSVLIQVKVSLDRIGVFLLEDEIREEDVVRNQVASLDISVQVRKGSFSWDIHTVFPTLKDINFTIKRGEKIAVCGPVGAGKSSILCSVLREIPRVSGNVHVFGSIAYVSQTSWIQSGTIRDSILFGKPMNKMKYENAIRCCALDKDIECFDHGDLTEIGQRGLNMSGGQKQRIQLARAVYADADIYLLDDPFSAVDAHTASVLFNDCVMRALDNKTVILVTHQVEFLPQTDKILVMENGQVTQSGSYNELLTSGTAFEQLVNAHESSMSVVDSVNNGTEVETHMVYGDAVQPTRTKSNGEISVASISTVQLTEDEELEKGKVAWKAFKDYLRVSNGYIYLASIIFCQCAFMTLQSLSSFWLAKAVRMSSIGSAVLVGVYAAISVISCLFVSVRSVIAAHFGLKASKAFFSEFMDSVFKAPMSFFDSTPVGRILTRASSDTSILDFDLPFSMTYILTVSIETTGIIIIMAVVTWQVLVVAIPVQIAVLYLQNYYLASARELVRINGTTKAPVVNFTSESTFGAVSIRAFAMTERFFQTNLKLIDTDASLFFYTVAAMEWVLIRVEALETLTVVASTAILVLLPDGAVSPGFLGLCLSYSLMLSQCQAYQTRYFSNFENHAISVERIKQFMHIPSEPPSVIDEKRPEPSWPSEGQIDLEALKVKYRPSAPYVLKGISCTFLAGNAVGVVGRTGSGKTTLISSLFRLVDPTEGRILIDGLDICSIGLKDLRSKLSIIPQEPTLFRGSVRNNLDPLGLYTDSEIWEALEKCQLKGTISSLPGLLDSHVNDDGDNWSAGQRQLFCLGRVLLRKNKILVLDEATASIDSATDSILQGIIKEEFSGCTVITIAHRVPTVTESDMVMVLSYGNVLEYDNPSKLLENSSSAFAKLVAEYWSNCKRK